MFCVCSTNVCYDVTAHLPQLSDWRQPLLHLEVNGTWILVASLYEKCPLNPFDDVSQWTKTFGFILSAIFEMSVTDGCILCRHHLLPQVTSRTMNSGWLTPQTEEARRETAASWASKRRTGG